MGDIEILHGLRDVLRSGKHTSAHPSIVNANNASKQTYRKEVRARTPVDRAYTASVEFDDAHSVRVDGRAFLAGGWVRRLDEAGEVQVRGEVRRDRGLAA